MGRQLHAVHTYQTQLVRQPFPRPMRPYFSFAHVKLLWPNAPCTGGAAANDFFYKVGMPSFAALDLCEGHAVRSARACSCDWFVLQRCTGPAAMIATCSAFRELSQGLHGVFPACHGPPQFTKPKM